MSAGALAWAGRALLPVGLGHAAAIALVAGAAVAGLSLDRSAMQAVAAGLLLVAAATHLRVRSVPRTRPTARIALALSSFIVSTAHGAGLLLVPALMPLCLGDPSTPTGAGSGPLLLALAAVAAHSAAMLVATAAVAAGAQVGLAALRRSLQTLSWSMSCFGAGFRCPDEDPMTFH